MVPFLLKQSAAAMALKPCPPAGILGFAAVLGGFAIAIAFAVMHVVAMHFVAGCDSFSRCTFWRVSSECGGGECKRACGESERSSVLDVR